MVLSVRARLRTISTITLICMTPELGERLLAFDQARTAKAYHATRTLISHSIALPQLRVAQVRSGVAPGGRSGSGSAQAVKLRGYNMPTSLLSSKSNSAPDIKRERLFKAPTLVSTAEN